MIRHVGGDAVAQSQINVRGFHVNRCVCGINADVNVWVLVLKHF